MKSSFGMFAVMLVVDSSPAWTRIYRRIEGKKVLNVKRSTLRVQAYV